MKTKEDLKQLYESTLKQQLSFMEDKRKEVLKWRVLSFIVLILSIFLFFVVVIPISRINNQFGTALLIITMPLMIALGFIFTTNSMKKYTDLYNEYRNQFKSNVIKKIINRIDSMYSFNEKGYVDKRNFTRSKIINKPFHLYNGEDLIFGFINKVGFSFSELKVQARKGKDKGIIEVADYLKSNDKMPSEYYERMERSKTDRNKYIKVFQGLFFVAEFNKYLNESTFVVPEKAHTNLLGKEKKRIEHYGNLIKLENPEFEKIFSVYGSSQQEARYVLTPTMMEAIVNVYKACGLKMIFSFTGNNVSCAIPMKKDMFEPTITRLIKYEELKKFYMLLGLIEIIINEMNLNTRIWTKK